MGELSQTIGKKLENFSSDLFTDLGWELLTHDLPIDCTRPTHKSATSKSGEKKTHGIDILQGFYNPFTNRKEAIIIECKNHQWKDFIPSNVNKWVDELLNTIECAATSPKVAPYIVDTTLTSGLLLFNSSDNIYDFNKVQEVLSEVVIPRRRIPTVLYLADTGKLEKWFALNVEISNIKKSNPDHNFGVIYPSIGGSRWDRQPIITPNYLFSDYILSVYTKTYNHENGTEKVDVKAIFCFDPVADDAMLYLLDMINSLQYEAHSERKQEIHVYFFPETADDRIRIRECFTKMISNEKPTFKIEFLVNRRLSPVV
jgi:hypothetical protein